jgi:acyl-CoA-binding protein
MNLNIEDKFKKSVNVSKLLTEYTLEHSELGKLYGLYKQSTCGNCTNSSIPSITDLKQYSKHTYWMKQQNKSKEDSMVEYTNLVMDLIDKYKK